MTRERAKTLLPEIIHWANGGNLWKYVESTKTWVMHDCEEKDELLFKSTTKSHYVIEDKHFEARKAFALGEDVERRKKYQDDTVGRWVGDASPSWNTNSYEYRPKPKEWYNNIPKEGILCWVWNDKYEKEKHASIVIDYSEQFKTFKIKFFENWWHNAELIKPEECYVSNKN